MTEKEVKRKAVIAGGLGTTGAAIGTAYSFNKPVQSAPRVTKEQKMKFIKKLQKGDILLQGGYKSGPWEKVLQSALNRNAQEYHVAVYTGGKDPRASFGELLIKDQKPSAGTVKKDLLYALSEDSHVALRPKWKTPVERDAFVRHVQKSLKTHPYDSKRAIMAWMANNLGAKNVSCKGRFCSNIVSTNLPPRMFKKNREIVMPKDFVGNKNFKQVAKLRAKEIHLPLSNKAIKKYILPAAAIGTAIGAIAG